MTGEQMNATAANERPKRSWNSSTKLTQPRHSATTTVRTRDASREVQSRRARTEGKTRTPRRLRNNGQRVEMHSNENENDQQTLTRELLERAVSTAFGGLLQESTLNATAFPEMDDSQSSELSSVLCKESEPPANSPSTKVETKLRSTLEQSIALSGKHRLRRREHAETSQEAANDTRATRELQRRMKHAAFEHRERKMAVQALQERIQREIQFLSATAADLEKQEFLLDDAFESYERALRLELDLAVDSRSPSNQRQVEASPRRSY